MLDSIQTYDRTAQTYDRAHRRWLHFAGGEAQCAFEGAVTALLQPSMKLLDAACGTGTVARRLLETMHQRLDVTLLDASKNMLSQCRDLKADRVLGRLQDLPFADQSFDLTTCAWGLETLPDPAIGLQELIRVTRVGGTVALVFCANRKTRTLFDYGLSKHVAVTGRGQFLDAKDIIHMASQFCRSDIRLLHSSGPAAALVIQRLGEKR